MGLIIFINAIFSELFSQTQRGTKRPFTAFHGRPNKKFKANPKFDKKKEVGKGNQFSKNKKSSNFKNKTNSRFHKNKNPSSKFKDKTNSHNRDFRPIGITKQKKR